MPVGLGAVPSVASLEVDRHRSAMNDATIELAQVDETSSAMNSPIWLSKRRGMSSGIEVVFARGTNEHRKRKAHRPRQARACAVAKRYSHIHRCRSRHRKSLGCVIGHIQDTLSKLANDAVSLL
jgi:hypothetical protein